MFTRAWLRETAYSTKNPTFSELAVSLNAGNRGFKAEFFTKCPGMEAARLRDFFPTCVKPSDPVRGYPGNISFGEIVLFDSLGELYDDLGDDTDLPMKPDGGPPGAFVLVDSRNGSFHDRSRSSSCIVDKGFMENSTNPIVALAEELQFEVPKPETPPFHLPLEPIACFAIIKLKKRYPTLSRNASVSEDSARWQRAGRLARKDNGSDRDDDGGHRLLASWIVGIPNAEVLELLSGAREETAWSYGISLDSTDEEADVE
jgi:hypothetical protein